MARCLPSDWRTQPLRGAATREFDLIERLAHGLPDGYTVFHGLHWSRLEQGLTVTGRLQFMVLTPRGALVIMALRTGLLKQENGRLFKRFGSESTDLFNELMQQRGVLLSLLSGLGYDPVVEPVLVCPDHQVPDATGLSVPADRVFDAKGQGGLIEALLAIDAAMPAEVSPAILTKLHQRLSNELRLVPEIGQLTQASEKWVTRLTQGLEDWVYRLDLSPFRLKIQGTAGSGKSLLALAEMRRNQLTKSRTLYVCYNRPLASDLLAQVRHENLRGVEALNFHALCDRLLTEAGDSVDFTKPDAFNTLVAKAAALPVNRRWVFDSIVVDEGQDFEPEWLPLLEKLSHENTRWLWLEDQAQNLYGRRRINLSGWVTLKVPCNYRNPQRVVDALRLLKPEFSLENPDLYSVDALCPLDGLEPILLEYENTDGLYSQTAAAITYCLKLGFTREQIAVLSISGLGNSQILKKTQLGPHRLRHFTGKYDEFGHQEFTDGDVLAETVYRFKGRSAQCIIVTEVDFAEYDERVYRKLFVAMTRAKMQVLLVAKVGLLNTTYFKSSMSTT